MMLWLQRLLLLSLLSALSLRAQQAQVTPLPFAREAAVALTLVPAATTRTTSMRR
jgi:hypothetical protein